jgi:hypothetical protein
MDRGVCPVLGALGFTGDGYTTSIIFPYPHRDRNQEL